MGHRTENTHCAQQLRECLMSSFDRRKFKADLNRAVKSAMSQGAPQVARHAMTHARSVGAGRVEFRCQSDGWTAHASSQAELERKLRQHFKSSRHRF